TYIIRTEDALKDDAFKTWLEDETKKKTVFDAKQVIVSLLHEGIDIKGIDFDLLLAAYIINPADNNEEVAAIARRNATSQLPFHEEVYGKRSEERRVGKECR